MTDEPHEDPYRGPEAPEAWYLLTVSAESSSVYTPSREYTYNVVTRRRPEEWLLDSLVHHRTTRHRYGPVGPFRAPTLVMARPISRELAQKFIAYDEGTYDGDRVLDRLKDPQPRTGL